MKWLLLVMYLTKFADLATTEMALARGGYEANVFMRTSTARIALTVAAPAVVYKLGTHLKSRKVRIITYIAVSAGWSLIAYNNYRVAKKLDTGRGFQIQFAVPF